MTGSFATLLLFLTAAAPAPAAAGHERVLTRVDAVTPLSAYRSGLLFSRRGADGRFRLMYASGNRPPARLRGVASRSVPFDADLGPGSRGGLLAVYSRCKTDPPRDQGDGATSPPDYTEGVGCRLFEYDLVRRRERALRSHGDEMLPAVWKRRLAFVRIVGGRAALYVRDRAGERARRLPGGPLRNAYDHPTSLDLAGRRLAVAWSFVAQSLGPASHIRLIDTATRATRVLDRYRGGGISSQSRIAPSFAGKALYWARACYGDPGGCPGNTGLIRRGLRSGRTAIAPIGTYDRWQARGRGVTWVLRDSTPFGSCRRPVQRGSRASCRIVATTPRYR